MILRLVEVFFRLFLTLSKRDRVIVDNLNLCFPELEENQVKDIKGKCIKFYSKAIYELITFKVFSRRWLQSNVKIDKLPKLDSTRANLLLSAHFSNFEILLQLAHLLNKKVYFFAKPFKPFLVFKLYTKLRAGKNAEWFTGLIRLKELLKGHQCVGFIFDQHVPKERAIICNFFGVPSTFPKFLPILINKFKPQIFFVSVRWLDGFYQVSFQELNLTDVENAQTLPSRLNSLVEALVQQHPEQYFWFHKKFKYFQQSQSG